MWKSNIWAGMLEGAWIGVEPKQYNSIYGEWIVPAIPSTSEDPTATVVVWIGIGGGGYIFGLPDTHNIIQIGTGANYLLGDPNYFAWWETFGMPSDKGELNPIDPYKYPIYPGDKMQAAIHTYGPGTWKMTLYNVTQKWPTAYENVVNYTGDQTTAEFIVEAPQKKDTNGKRIPLPLPNYGTVTFDNCRINGEPPNFGFEYICDMQDPKNPQRIISRTGGPDMLGDAADRDGFRVAYGHIYPGAPTTSL